MKGMGSTQGFMYDELDEGYQGMTPLLARQIILEADDDWDTVENDTESKNHYYEARDVNGRSSSGGYLGGFTVL